MYFSGRLRKSVLWFLCGSALFSHYYSIVWSFWFYVACLAVFYRYVFLFLIQGKILSGMALVIQPLVMLFGAAAYYDDMLPNHRQFPSSVLHADLVSTGLAALILFSSIVTLILSSRASRRLDWDSFKQYRWVKSAKLERILGILIFIGSGLTILTSPGATIFEHAYSELKFVSPATIESSAVKLMGSFAMCTTLVLGAGIYGSGSKRYYSIVVFVVLVTGYFVLLSGDRSGMMPILFTALFVWSVGSDKKILSKLLVMVVVFLFVGLVFSLFSTLRASAAGASIGDAVSLSFQGLATSEANIEGVRSGLLALSLLPQSFWHVLHTVDLYKLDVSLHWISFRDIILQSIPAFVADLLSYERPLNGAWRLAEYRVHGGGMNIVALAFWNGGLFAVSVFSVVFGLIVKFLERWFRERPPIALGGYFVLASAMPYLMTYGWQPLFKVMLVMFLFSLVIPLFVRSYVSHTKVQRVR